MYSLNRACYIPWTRGISYLKYGVNSSQDGMIIDLASTFYQKTWTKTLSPFKILLEILLKVAKLVSSTL